MPQKGRLCDEYDTGYTHRNGHIHSPAQRVSNSALAAVTDAVRSVYYKAFCSTKGASVMSDILPRLQTNQVMYVWQYVKLAKQRKKAMMT